MTIRIWNNDECEIVLTGHTHWVQKVIELPNGQLATCSSDTTVRLWNVTTGESQELTGHAYNVTSLVQIDSETILSGGMDDTIRVWRNGNYINHMACSGCICSMIPIKL
jgi:WD40 repeat protein